MELTAHDRTTARAHQEASQPSAQLTVHPVFQTLGFSFWFWDDPPRVVFQRSTSAATWRKNWRGRV